MVFPDCESSPASPRGRPPSSNLLRFVALAGIVVLVVGALAWRTLTGGRAAAGSAASIDPTPVVVRSDGLAPVASDRVELAARRESEPASAPARADAQPKTHLSIRGIAVDEAGLPLGECKLGWSAFRVATSSDGGSAVVADPQRGSLVTGPDGAFAWTFEDEVAAMGNWREVVLEFSTTVILERRHGRWRLPDDDADVDLGACELALPHTFLEGYVVDRHGAALGGVGAGAVYSGDELARECLRRGFIVGRSTDPKGHFALQGWEDGVRVDLEVRGRGWTTELVRGLVTPATNLLIQMRPDESASLSVQVVIDASVGGCSLRVVAVDSGRDGDDMRTFFDRQRTPSENGESLASAWIAQPIEPGRYRVEVRDPDTGVVFAAIEGVDVSSGQATRDPRVQPIDLRGRLRVVRLQTVTNRGDVLGEQRIELVGDAGKRHTPGASPEGWITFAMPIDAPDLIGIDARGERCVLRDGAQVVVYVE